MPQFAVPAIAGAAGIASGTLGYAALSVVVNVAFTVATQALVQSLQKPPKPADRRESIKSEVAPRLVHFGRTLAGSSVVYDRAASKVRWQVHVHNHGEVQRLHKLLLNGELRQILPTGEARPDQRFKGNVYVEFHEGSTSQPASQLMLFPDVRKNNAIAPDWTTAHRLRGLAYTVVRARTPSPENFNSIYVGGRPPVPTIEADFGTPLDPRTGQRTFSDNAALVTAWFLTHPLGMRLPESKIDWDWLKTAANACDALGYKVGGSWSAIEPPKVALANFLAAMDGATWVGRDGRIRIDPGRYQAPDVKLTADNAIIAVNSLSSGQEEGQGRTEQIVRFSDRTRDYSEVEETAAILNDAAVHEPDEYDLTYVHDKPQALKLGRRAFARAHAPWRAELTTNLTGLKLMNKRFFELHLPEFGVINQDMELEGWRFDLATGQCQIAARSVSAADFT